MNSVCEDPREEILAHVSHTHTQPSVFIRNMHLSIQDCLNTGIHESYMYCQKRIELKKGQQDDKKWCKRMTRTSPGLAMTSPCATWKGCRRKYNISLAEACESQHASIVIHFAMRTRNCSLRYFRDKDTTMLKRITKCYTQNFNSRWPLRTASEHNRHAVPQACRHQTPTPKVDLHAASKHYHAASKH